MTGDATGILRPYRKYLEVLAELHFDRKVRGKLDPQCGTAALGCPG